MKLIIDITDEMLEAIKEGTWCGSHKLEIAIRNGIPYEESPHGKCQCAECRRIFGKEADNEIRKI